MPVDPKTNENILFLTVGKDVKLNFTNKKQLDTIQLSLNKIAEIFRNGLVDKATIFDVDTIGLITKSNHVTYVDVRTGRRCIIGNDKYTKVPIDQKRTKGKKENSDIFAHSTFEFFVSQDIPKDELVLPFNTRK